MLGWPRQDRKSPHKGGLFYAEELGANRLRGLDRLGLEILLQ